MTSVSKKGGVTCGRRSVGRNLTSFDQEVGDAQVELLGRIPDSCESTRAKSFLERGPMNYIVAISLRNQENAPTPPHVRILEMAGQSSISGAKRLFRRVGCGRGMVTAGLSSAISGAWSAC